MHFSTRNAFYLRASNYRVVPLFLYLDERHVDWMSEVVLQQVIAELHRRVQDLLMVERHAKKHRVHVERGDGFQYCYFLRKTTRTEVVLLKNKTFSLRRPSPPPPPPPAPTPRKRKRATRSRTRSVSLAASQGRNADDDEYNDGDSDDDDFQIKPDPDAPPPPADGEEDETSIKDWKPDVSLTYQGFGTSSVQLVLIVEPYPPLPPSEYAPPSSRLSSRSASIAASRSRSRTMGPTGGRGTRYSSTSLALDNPTPRPQVAARNMRNATRSVSVATTSSTPAPGGRSSTPGGAGMPRGRTPLFIPRDTPFEDDEEDEDEHEAYADALREGRYRLPSVMERDEQEDVPEDEPEGMMAMGKRLLHSSEIEEGVIRNSEGWEERGEGQESDVLGREEPGD